jgi:hypothetical protein
MRRCSSLSSTGSGQRRSRGLPSSPTSGRREKGRQTQQWDSRPSPRHDCSASCSVAATTCSLFAGRTRRRAARATHHDAQTSGGQESARNRRSAVVPASARRSPRSMSRSCLRISAASKSSGSIRCSPTTRASCWRSISTATPGGRTRSYWSTCASRLASSPPWSVLGPAMAPTCGSSSRTRYQQQTHAGSGSQS